MSIAGPDGSVQGSCRHRTRAEARATAWDEGHRSGYADCASDDAQVTGNPYRTTDPKGSNHG